MRKIILEDGEELPVIVGDGTVWKIVPELIETFGGIQQSTVLTIEKRAAGRSDQTQDISVNKVGPWKAAIT